MTEKEYCRPLYSSPIVGFLFTVFMSSEKWEPFEARKVDEMASAVSMTLPSHNIRVVSVVSVITSMGGIFSALKGENISGCESAV